MAEKGLRASDLRAKTDAELRILLEERAQELMNLRFQRASARLEKPARFRQLKRERARILTVLAQRRRGLREERNAK
ncbi:MAG: 50S ribosomal protein L29 [Candidatus Hydrogenedentota bacterium]|nr:MAG: 50S ribosomal protein L29 [Candidatus Hydrogenedentota bacterium]